MDIIVIICGCISALGMILYCVRCLLKRHKLNLTAIQLGISSKNEIEKDINNTNNKKGANSLELNNHEIIRKEGEIKNEISDNEIEDMYSRNNTKGNVSDLGDV